MVSEQNEIKHDLKSSIEEQVGEQSSTDDSSDSSKSNSIHDHPQGIHVVPQLAKTTEPVHQSTFEKFFHPRKNSAQFETISDNGSLDEIATQKSIYDDDEFAKYNQPHPKWENLHRFDPSFRWTWRQERKLVKKMDIRIAFWAVVMFFCLDLDRENISQANSDNLLKNIHLTTADYNLGNTLFKLGFLLAELPSQMISKKVGPDRWVPTQMVLWSIFSGAQFFMNGRASFLAFRWMIGMLQGGFIPDIILWLSYFYTRTELPLRLAYFWVSNYLVKIVSPFLALGLLRLGGKGGHAGWRYLFLIEGLLTFVVGLFSFVQMPAGPTQTKNWFYRKGWFDENEEKIIVNRAIRDDPSKGDMHNRQGIDWQGFKTSLLDYDLWPMYFLGLIFLMPTTPVQNYLTLQLRHFGFSTEATNALSIPAPALGLVFLVIITMISERVNNRSFVAMSIAIWNTAFCFGLFALPVNANKWVYWAVASLDQAYPYVHALQVAWISRQSGSIRTRTISAAIYNMTVQVSGIIGSNVYQPSDAPLYRKGNLSMAILSVFTIFVYFGIFFYYRFRNQYKENKWNQMTRDQQLHYLATTNDKGNRRLDFRFAT